MKILLDYQDVSIRLTDERLDHLLQHPEMMELEMAIAETVLRPQQVVESLTDSLARLYYRFYTGTTVGDKYLCVIVKVVGDDAFVLTAYLTDKVKRGVRIWPRGK